MNLKQEITAEKLSLFEEKIEKNKKLPGPLMLTLHDAQHIFGCISLPIQKIIAKELDKSVATINGVVTFYSEFTIKPLGKQTVGVCLGTACYVKGAKSLLNTVVDELGIKAGETTSDGEFTFLATRCIGACGLAPILSVGSQIYGNISVAKTEKIIREIKGDANETE